MKKLLCILAAAVMVWVLWANRAIEVNEWVIGSPEIPAGFDGFRIAQVSDLHNTEFGAGNETLLKLLEEAEPDIIVITGDLIDSRNPDPQIALAFAERAVQIAPCFCVSGNHEARSAQWDELRKDLTDAGVAVLTDQKLPLERGGDTLTLIGLQDPDFGADFEGNAQRLTEGEAYTILLSHRPERMALYRDCGADLVFSGHAHGGQVRVPFLGGLIAPHQGFFPKYDSGLYREDGTVMLISRGLGNSICPLRLNNRPEILVAVLKRI